MHELSIAESLFELCRERLPAGHRLATVQIDVGELSSIEPELLRFAWQAVVAGSPHTDAALQITWHRAEQLCPRCGEVAERQPGSWLRFCPLCLEPLSVRGGDQLDLVAITTIPLPADLEVSS
ncbi:MAG: hydrogenase maturation nickel metallochaperone HypA [Planctomycetes bacterium]|nr:hydrogenase maturation nickel metallochaperone HypA [Planctomycetota bacterium]MCC7398009.1 hydrogenase maturation nickel metallochaperone HypA [Planctomycetota bacterium]